MNLAFTQVQTRLSPRERIGVGGKESPADTPFTKLSVASKNPRQKLDFPKPSPFRKYWTLAPKTVFLNHGSFGACPKAVLAAQAEFIRRMEAEPIEFLWRRYEEPLDAARNALSKF